MHKSVELVHLAAVEEVVVEVLQVLDFREVAEAYNANDSTSASLAAPATNPQSAKPICRNRARRR